MVLKPAVYLAMAGFLWVVACIGAAIVYFLLKREKEAVTEVQQAAQVRVSSKRSQHMQDNKMEDCQSLQAPQAEGQRARPVNRAQAGVRRRQRAAAAAAAAQQQQQQEEQQAAASNGSGSSEVAFTRSWRLTTKCLLLHASYAFQLPVFNLKNSLLQGEQDQQPRQQAPRVAKTARSVSVQFNHKQHLAPRVALADVRARGRGLTVSMQSLATFILAEICVLNSNCAVHELRYTSLHHAHQWILNSAYPLTHAVPRCPVTHWAHAVRLQCCSACALKAWSNTKCIALHSF